MGICHGSNLSAEEREALRKEQQRSKEMDKMLRAQNVQEEAV